MAASNYPAAYATAVRYGRTQTTDALLKLLHENPDARQPGSDLRLIAADAFDEADEPHKARILRSPAVIHVNQSGLFGQPGAEPYLFKHEVNGTTYDAETPDAVIRHLEEARRNGTRIHLRYGDTDTGRDWLDEHDTVGAVGRSGGSQKIPLLINNRRSTGGGGILDSHIVKIMRQPSRVVLYQHPTYHHPKIDVVHSDNLPPSDTESPLFRIEYRHHVMAGGERLASFRTPSQLTRYLKKLGLTPSDYE